MVDDVASEVEVMAAAEAQQRSILARLSRRMSAFLAAARGNTPASSGPVNGPGTPVQFRLAESAAFAHHVYTERAETPKIIKRSRGANGLVPKTDGAQSYSLAWDEDDALGTFAGMRRAAGGMPERDRKQAYYDAYKLNPWISACIDKTASRITSGGYAIEPVQPGEGSDENRQAVEALFGRINNYEDFSHWLKGILIDRRIFGEAYAEIVYGPDGRPAQLHKIDCITMSYKLDPHGNVLEYIQELTTSNKRQTFQPKQIIHFWDHDPRAGHRALSPIEKILQAHYMYLCMVEWQQNFFKKGAKPSMHLHFATEFDAKRHLEWIIENATGLQNAHSPIVTWGSGTAQELGKGSVEIDFDRGMDKVRDTIIAGLGLYPAILGIIETGNIGGGTGESQDKAFVYNTCDPLKQDTMEKINWHVVNQGFSIKDWRVNTRYADYRSDLDIIKVQDTRIRNGSRTVDEVRQEEGKHPYADNMGSVPIITTGKDVLPLARLGDLESEQRQTAQLQIQQQQAATELAQVQLDKAKNPDPVPAQLQQSGQPEGRLPVNKQDEQAEAFISFFGILVESLIKKEVRERFHIAESHPDFQLVVDAYRPFVEQHALRKAEELLAWHFAQQQQAQPSTTQLTKETYGHPHTLQTDRSLNRNAATLAGETSLSQPAAHPQSESGNPDCAQDAHAQEGIPAAGTLHTPPAPSTARDSKRQYHSSGAASGIGEAAAAQRPAILEQHTGMMIAFMLDQFTAEQLAIAGGEPANELHCTLCYMGDMAEPPEDGKRYPHTATEQIKALLTDFATKESPLAGRITGLGRFQPAETETHPIIALVDMPGLAELRTRLAQALAVENYFVASNHGYTPHITLAYVDQDASLPVENIPMLPLVFDTITLAIGDDRYTFPLTAKPAVPAQEAQGDVPALWEPPDIEDILKGMLDEGYQTHTWHCKGTACSELCWPNQNVTVPVGKPFPSGVRVAPAHPNCDCETVPSKEPLA